MRIDLGGTGTAGSAVSDPALNQLADGFARGDLTPKRYARLRQDRLAVLGRELIGPSLEPEECVVAEHHWVEGHRRLPDAPFAETAQVGVSLYVTDRRLFRWRFQDRGSPAAVLQPDVQETLDFRWFSELLDIERRRLFRRGEAATGLAIAGAGWAFAGHLAFTGPVLVAVGAFGVLHALAVPSRYVLVRTTDGDDGWAVWATRTGSGRALMSALAAALERSGRPPAGPAEAAVAR